ncbi:diguanylate cyclase [Thiomicrorhabdus heinhorstiae]|uniref:diguanylate cyclase n=1 Tax=Thiomicrorhabdus heinhorstiae TaxID=2748010 RepID=A0ABS0BSI2_9GAMM|nr:diguanylate cyclase [Thiomicrorhabdus heinhorstiae]MBF6056755.1 diguanylate cyclase [Thiomicrorhabdus heinhorstiae]
MSTSATLLDIQDPFEKALKIFSRIEAIFQEQDINPIPLNYYIWYQYFKGDNPKFRQEMDAALSDPYGYSDRLGRRLYQTYFEGDDVNEAIGFDQALKRLLSVMARRMESWTQKLEVQTSELQNCSERLTHQLPQEEVKEIADQVRHRASSMQELSESFKQQMTTNYQEISELRKKLVDARAEVLKDELTEIGSRKAFNLALEDYTRAYNNGEYERAPVLILCDIDHFKQFNDSYGHLIGDSILRYFANLLKKNALVGQVTCRYGGEEFVILLENTSFIDGVQLAESKRQAIETAQLKRKGSEQTLKQITASFGVAHYRKDEAPELFIKRSDDALYKAKNSGRNRVVGEDEL